MAHTPSQHSFSEVMHLPSYHQTLPGLSDFVARYCRAGDVYRMQALARGEGLAISVFDGLAPGPLSVQDYFIRLCQYGRSSPSVFPVAGVLLTRLLCGRKVHLNSFSVHRLLIGVFLLAAKLRDDMYFQQSYYAAIGGVPTAEVNRMEQEILRLLDCVVLCCVVLGFRLDLWDIVVTAEQLASFAEGLKQEAWQAARSRAVPAAPAPVPRAVRHVDAREPEDEHTTDGEEGGLTEEDSS
eukprot:TRINITY_DN1449_c1_g2_i4.p2 TRINITY_DN1449_c1_g2~~TRINITY_DN1449_c1_g2_i4.p2  ORF type:complete len:239 (+),score=96.69 TRINITY_DN1449_c1_g2_i4:320-1036(+)